MENSDENEKLSSKWHHATEDSWHDTSRPMTHDEMVQFYWEAVDQNPVMLAELYVDFHEFDQIEFILFRDRLSAAILVSNATQQAVGQLDAQITQAKKDGTYIVPGWEGESREVIDESAMIINDASKISIGATMLTAVAALEGLLKDLTPGVVLKRDGLQPRMKYILSQYDIPPDAEMGIMEMARKVGRRRNAFAHELTGSYFPNQRESELKEPEFRFDIETMHDTLFTVGEIAVVLEGLIMSNGKT